MSTHLRTFVLVVVVLLGTCGIADPVAAADGSVRFLSAGPVRLGDGHIGHMRVFLPATQRSIQVHFLGERGAVLRTLEVEPPGRGPSPFFEVFFEAKFAAGRGPGLGTLSITDGTSNTFVHEGSDGIIAILIGLKQTGGTGTMQIFDGGGQIVGILPYLEQDNLFRR